MSNRPGFILVALLLISLAAISAWQLIFVIRRADFVVEPSMPAPGTVCEVHVKLLNGMGFAAPFARRSVAVGIDQGDENGTLELTNDPMVFKVRTSHAGEIILRISVEGLIIPYMVTIRVTPLLAKGKRLVLPQDAFQCGAGIRSCVAIFYDDRG